jgi:hypothetical protein
MSRSIHPSARCLQVDRMSRSIRPSARCRQVDPMSRLIRPSARCLQVDRMWLLPSREGRKNARQGGAIAL